MPAHFGISGTSLGVPQGGGTPPGGGDPGMTYTAPSQPIVGDGGADIDTTYSAADAYFEPTYEKTFLDKVRDYYEGGGLLGMGMRKIGGMLNPENQYEGIVGETDYGAGDYVSTIADWAESRGLTDDYAGEDSETQMVIDKQMWDAGIRSPSFEVFYEGGGDSSNFEDLTSSESSALEQLITPSLSGIIGGDQLPESVFDKYFSNISKAGENIMSQYNLAKAKTNNFITTPMTTASYGIFEDARLRGLI